MAEQMMSITDARKGLPGLSQAAQKRMERYVITLKGQPQSVLVGYAEYEGMKAAVELLDRPQDVASIRRGLAELKAGKGLTSEQARQRLRERAQESTKNALATELSDRSGVQVEIVGAVVDTMVDKLKADFSAGRPVSLPGIGNICIVDAGSPVLPEGLPKGYVVVNDETQPAGLGRRRGSQAKAVEAGLGQGANEKETA